MAQGLALAGQAILRTAAGRMPRIFLFLGNSDVKSTDAACVDYD